MNDWKLHEPCQPYVIHPYQPSPVYIWDILDRLSPDQWRQMAMALAIHAPKWFENKLLDFSNGE